MFRSRKSDPRRMVQVYDLDTRTNTTIPAAELAPGMVEVEIIGLDGKHWVDSSKLQKGQYQHPPFDEQGREIMRYLEATFGDVYPTTAEEWEDGFRRDLHVEREIGMWLRAAEVFTDFLADKGPSFAYKEEAFRVLLSAMNNSRDEVLTVVDLGEMPREDAEELVQCYYEHSA